MIKVYSELSHFSADKMYGDVNFVVVVVVGLYASCYIKVYGEPRILVYGPTSYLCAKVYGEPPYLR